MFLLFFQIINLAFIVYYVLEQCLKMWSLSFRRYFWEFSNGFDCMVIIVLVESTQ